MPFGGGHDGNFTLLGQDLWSQLCLFPSAEPGFSDTQYIDMRINNIIFNKQSKQSKQTVLCFWQNDNLKDKHALVLKV